jgi:HSP20 family protein
VLLRVASHHFKEVFDMALMRHEPWSLIPQLQDEINRVFGAVSGADSSAATADWVPAVDINEFTDRFELYVDLPGVDVKNVEITLDNGVLAISGGRTVMRRDGDELVRNRMERSQGRFHRRFVLPETVDSDGVKAAGRDGVLEVTIPKQAKALPRRIKVAA